MYSRLRALRASLGQLSMACAAVTLVLLSGCSTTTAQRSPSPEDPLEPINRISFEFNEQIDKYAFKPAAIVYKDIVPWQARQGVTNFFSNMGEVPTFANDVLQGHIAYATLDFWRFAINTTAGIGGVFDVATHMGLEKRYNDFGLTLAKWGVTTAPYIVIPFIGPSTIRDGLAIYVNYEYFSIWPYIYPVHWRNSLFALDVINLRASLLEAENVMDEAALDRYVFIRNAYLQKRQSLIRSNGANQYGDELAGDPLGADDLDFALQGENASSSTASSTTITQDDIDFALDGETPPAAASTAPVSESSSATTGE